MFDNEYLPGKWIPTDYNPGITKEQWVDLLNDKDVFTISSLQIMKRIKDYGGAATCAQLSLKYGETYNFYNSGSTWLAKRIVKKTGCPLSIREDESKRYWPVLYLGKDASNEDEGSFIWKLREELAEALELVDLSGIELYSKVAPSGYWSLNANPNKLYDKRCLQKQYESRIKDLYDIWKQRNGTVKTIKSGKEAEITIDHTQNFISDGVVCPEKWFSQSVRPLYLLKEAYGEGSWDLINDLLCKSKRISQMWRCVSEWTYGLLGTTAKALMPYGKWRDVDHYGNEYLQQIAVVNVKKSGGKSNSDMDEIRAYAKYDREVLLREIELCDPTVIICGYTVSVLDILFQTPVRKSRNANLFYHIQLNDHDVLVLDYWHPANLYPDVMNYYGLIGIYQQALIADNENAQ